MKIAAVVGITLGAVHPVAAYLALTVALVLGAVEGAVYRKVTRERAFPFAPAISLATLAVLLVIGLVGVPGGTL